MKKTLLTTLVAFLLTTQSALAKNIEDDLLKYAFKKTNIPKSSISISIKNLKTGKTEYEHYSKIQISPASTQKILTYFSSIDTLGKDYNFSTKLYKTTNNEYFIKLGADPYFTKNDLKKLISNIKQDKNEVLTKLFIDDTVVDNTNWGEGWQWDDGLNKLMPKFGAYNIDKNLYTINVIPSTLNAPANIYTQVFYPTTFINKTITSNVNNTLKISKEENDISADALTFKGEVSKKNEITIPIPNLRKYFILRLDEALVANKISYNCKYERKKVPTDAILISEIEHPISESSIDVLKRSNNLIAESIFKLAGAKFANQTGSSELGIQMFENYCQKQKIDCSEIHLTDGSGVSKNNLITADFMTNFLLKLAKYNEYNCVKKELPTAGEGTLTDRLHLLKDKVYVKTGTLSNISGIAGYLDTKKGNSYAIAIYITDGKSKESSKKIFENIILKYIYNNK